MDPNRVGGQSHPESTAYFDILLRWINPLIELANKRPLTPADVWDCPSHETVEYHTSNFWKAWLEEVKHAEETSRKPSFVWALFVAFGDRLLIAGAMQLGFLILQLGQPFLVAEIVSYIQNGEGGIGRGVGFAIGFGALAFGSSLLLSRVFDVLRRLGDAVRAGVMMAVYEQSLKLTTAARLKNTIGQTTNLIAIDVEKLNLAVQFFHYLWHGPLVCVIVMIILITQIGYQAALAGMAFICVLVPLQNHIAALIGVNRRAMVRSTDERVKLINELLQSIRVVKLYAWEAAIEERIREVRKKETTRLHAYLDLVGYLREVLFAAQPVAAIIMFATAFYGADKPMSVVQIFRMLAFLNITRFPFNLLSQGLKAANDALVSIQRLDAFFCLPVLHESDGSKCMAQLPSITLEDATYSWEDVQVVRSSRRDHIQDGHCDIESNELDELLAKTFSLRNIQFKAQGNELIALVGQVGCGKSSLLSAFLNEMTLVRGKRDAIGTIAYCAQTPWIQNLTLKQNVLFEIHAKELSMQQESDYRRAIHAAALTSDIAILSNGDETEIGERGINLSGGQKARVSLARAFFSRYRSQIYLLDDPFSAVDGNTGNHIFQHGVLDLLHDKLRIVALNSHMHLLKRFDRIIVLDEGRIILDGSFEYLFTNHSELMMRITGLSPTLNGSRSAAEESKAVSESDVALLPEASAVANESELEIIGDEERSVEISIEPTPDVSEASIAPLSGQGQELKKMEETASPAANVEGGKLIKVERADTGISLSMSFLKYFTASLVSLPKILEAPLYRSQVISQKESNESIYTPWLYFLGFLMILSMFLVFAGSQLFRIAVDLLLAKVATYWDDGLRTRHYYENWYYSSFGLLIFSVLVRSVYFNFFTVRSSRVLHAQILRKVLAAPVPLFFDTHTIGAILNRFAKDMETVDSNVPEFLLQLIVNWFQVFAVFGLCIWASPWFAILLVPMCLVFFKMYVFFSSASRDLKRLEAVSRSPIYSSLSETLAGLETIRAFGDTSRFLMAHRRRMDGNKKLLFHQWVCMSWMTVRLELSTATVLLAIALICVCLRDTVSPIALGLALSYGLQLTALFQRCVQLIIEVINYMTSTDRVLEYLTIPQEMNTIVKAVDGAEKDHEAIDPLWPQKGSIKLEDVWMQYRDNPPVLRGLNVDIQSGQRIGVCGRTGAGKVSDPHITFLPPPRRNTNNDALYGIVKRYDGLVSHCGDHWWQNSD